MSELQSPKGYISLEEHDKPKEDRIICTSMFDGNVSHDKSYNLKEMMVLEREKNIIFQEYGKSVTSLPLLGFKLNSQLTRKYRNINIL